MPTYITLIIPPISVGHGTLICSFNDVLIVNHFRKGGMNRANFQEGWGWDHDIACVIEQRSWVELKGVPVETGLPTLGFHQHKS
jgi:hypothetical protein